MSKNWDDNCLHERLSCQDLLCIWCGRSMWRHTRNLRDSAVTSLAQELMETHFKDLKWSSNCTWQLSAGKLSREVFLFFNGLVWVWVVLQTLNCAYKVVWEFLVSKIPHSHSRTHSNSIDFICGIIFDKWMWIEILWLGQIFALMNESVIGIMSGFYFLKHFFVTKVSSVLSTSSWVYSPIRLCDAASPGLH